MNNPVTITDSVPGTGDSGSCSYSHDDLGRLSGVDCGGSWQQTFTMDAFGNTATAAGVGTSFSASFNAADEIAEVGGNSGLYDADGNLLNDHSQGQAVVNAYDAEGRPVNLEGTLSIYDALGRRVEANPGTPKELLYGPAGAMLAVMAGQTQVRARIALPGGSEADYAGSDISFWRHAGGLGTARLDTDPNHRVFSSAAYAPYAITYAATGTGDRDFTGAEQDVYSGGPGGVEDFPAREYSPIQARWWAPDPAGLAAVDPANPQSWNRYAYALNNPASRIDPTGLDSIGICRPVAKLHVDFGDDSAASADGPYDPGFESGSVAGSASGDDGYSGCAEPLGDPFNIFAVDGVEVDGGLAVSLGGLGTGGPFGEGGASNITVSSTVTPATPYVPGHDGDPVPYEPSLMSAGTACTTVAGSNSWTCTAYLAEGWKAAPGAGTAVPIMTAPAALASSDASGLGALVGGFESFTRPLELLEANNAMFFTGGAATAFGYSLAVATCLDPTPLEPLTCAAGGLGGLAVGATGLSDLALSAYFFKKYTLPAFENWGGND